MLPKTKSDRRTSPHESSSTTRQEVKSKTVAPADEFEPEDEDDEEVIEDKHAVPSLQSTSTSVADSTKSIDVDASGDVLLSTATSAGSTGLLRCGVELTLAFEDITHTATTTTLKAAKAVVETTKAAVEIVQLQGVSGYCASGSLTAVMGSTEQTRATLLAFLAGRRDATADLFEGKVLLNGHVADQSVRQRVVGYCWSHDALWSNLTVRETLLFSATLAGENSAFVDAWLDLLDLQAVATYHIGECALDQRRRVSIGVELVAGKSVLLVDAPTRDLTDQGAKAVMNCLRRVAKTGRAVLCALDDPAPSVLRAFTRLLLLSRESGELVFAGDVGTDFKLFTKYLQAAWSIKKLPPSASAGSSSKSSIASWALQHMEVGNGKNSSAAKFVKLFNQSEAKRTWTVQLQRAGILRPAKTVPAIITTFGSSSHATSAWFGASVGTQLRWVMWRFVISYLRLIVWATSRVSIGLSRQTTMAVGAVLFGMFIVLLRARQDEYDTFAGVNHGVGLIAWTTLLFGAVLGAGAVSRALEAGRAFRQEHASHIYYPTWVFYASEGVSDVPLVAVLTFVLTSILFVVSSLWHTTGEGSFWLYWLILTTFVLTQLYCAQWLAYVTHRAHVAIAGIVGLNVFSLIVVHFVPSLLWLLSIMPQRYAFGGLFAIAFGDCSDRHDHHYESEAIPCHPLREIPKDAAPYYEHHRHQQVTVHSYVAEEFASSRDDVAFNVWMLLASLVVFRYLAVVAVQRRRFVYERRP